MSWRSFCRDLMYWSAGTLLLVVAVVVVFPAPDVGLEGAVQVASRKLLAIDPTFRPADHVARVYYECSRAPLTIDYSPQDAGPLVARVRVGPSGSVRGAAFFRPEQGVESYRTGSLFRLKPDGSLGEEIPPRRTRPAETSVNGEL